MDEVLEIQVKKYGKEWDGRGSERRLGKRPLEAAACLIEDYDLPCTPVEFNAESLALLGNRCDRSPSCYIFFATKDKNSIPGFLRKSVSWVDGSASVVNMEICELLSKS